MKTLGVFLLYLLTLTNVLGQSTVFENVNLIDVENGIIVPNQHVLLTDDRISIISGRRIKKADKRIDASEKYLIPGLWDMHVHLSMVGEASIPLFVMNGVTGVRDMGGNWAQLLEWRSYSENPKQFDYPTIKSAGPILESPRFYALLQQLLGRPFTQNRIVVSSPEEAKPLIDSLARLQVDLVKIRTVASSEVFEALAKACKDVGLDFTGHIDQGVDFATAIQSGISSIEHNMFLQILGLTSKEQSRAIQSIGTRKIYFTPTLSATHNTRIKDKSLVNDLVYDSLNEKDSRRRFLSPELIESWMIESQLSVFESPMNWDSIMSIMNPFTSQLVKRTRLLAGTDTGVRGIFPGWGLHEELERMVNELGITPLKALQSATINPVRSLNLENEFGTVEEGKKADLVLLNSNPLQDISNSSDIFLTVKNGKLLDNKLKNDLLLEVEKKIEKQKEVFQPDHLSHLNKILQRMKSGK